MTKQYLTGMRSALICAAIAAVVFVPMTSTLAQQSLVDSGDDIKRPNLHQRANYAWPYATGPHYGDVVADIPGTIRTPVGSFHLSQGELPIPTELSTPLRLEETGLQHFIVAIHPDLQMRADIQETIVGTGGKIISLDRDSSMTVAMTAAGHRAVQNSVGVLGVVPYHAAFKLHPSIGRTPLANPIKANASEYTLDVRLWEAEDGKVASELITQLGASVELVQGNQLRVVADRALLASIAQIESVQIIFEVLPKFFDSEETTTTMMTGQYNDGEVPYHDAGVNGGGSGTNFCDFATDTPYTPCLIDDDCSGTCNQPAVQILLVLDSGLQLDGADLSDTRVLAGEAGADHRKVRNYESVGQFGGQGDLKGCDDEQQGGFTHGHVVAATALGNASTVNVGTYGTPWFALDVSGEAWNLDGVAMRAQVVIYDAQVTPPSVSCADPVEDGVLPGDLYNSADPVGSVLGKAYETEHARIMNFSWSSPSNTYDGDATDIDQFLAEPEYEDALVIVSAGNNGTDSNPPDSIPDRLTVGAPGTFKNGLAIGASANANLGVNSPNSRAFFSSVGPAIDFNNINRVSPQLMAPGTEIGGGLLGISSEFGCRTSDNDQLDPVECDLIQGLDGTSFSAPAVSGAALVIRDYFAQGFYPDREQDEATRRTSLSGAVVKAMLIASAEWMYTPPGVNLTDNFRFNNEQGYGRVQLDNLLPVSNWPASPTGLIVSDPLSTTSSLGLPFSLAAGTEASSDFTVCSDTEELSIVLSWVDRATSVTGKLENDLDLEVTSPSGKVYRGNNFTDDANRSGSVFASEDCPPIGSRIYNLDLDEGPWSIPLCDNTKINNSTNPTGTDYDADNPHEAVFLSPDPEGNPNSANYEPNYYDGVCQAGSGNLGGTNTFGLCGNDLDCAANPANPQPTDWCEGGTRQVEIGTWSVKVKAKLANDGVDQRFAVAIAGGVCLGSSVRFSQGRYTCNDPAVIQVTEFADTTDPDCKTTADCTPSDIEPRTSLRVFEAGAPNAKDCEGPACGICTGGGAEICFTDDDCPGAETCTAAPTAGLTFTQRPDSFIFESTAINLTDGTVATSGNGTLDVRDGDRIEVLYGDKTALGTEDVDRLSQSTVGCQVAIDFGGNQVFLQFGTDTATLVQGGCERALQRHERCIDGSCLGSGTDCSATGLDVDCPMEPAGFFEFGFPDSYMDAGELIQLNLVFASQESVDLDNVVANLRCVNVDEDSPAECLPSGAGCTVLGCATGSCSVTTATDCKEDADCPLDETCTPPPGTVADLCDPTRANNTACPYMSILNAPQLLGLVPSGLRMSSNFAIQMADDSVFDGSTPTVELLLALTSDTSGRTASGLAVSRQRLNIDTEQKLYNTDFPTGGTDLEVLDMNNNERQDDPINDLSGYQGFDYRFETKSYSDMTENGGNMNLLSPWNFDGNNGGFASGLNAQTTPAAQGNLIANFGEDKNFNGIEDGTCENFPAIACWTIGTDADARCPDGDCISEENNKQNGTFDEHYNTKGGCGWQTKAPHFCLSDSSRGCFDTADCQGTCQVLTNGILSTFAPCSGACPQVQACAPALSDYNYNDACEEDADCSFGSCSVTTATDCLEDGDCPPTETCIPPVDGTTGACQDVTQTCEGNAGTCDLDSVAVTGGVWHTGEIGLLGDGTCDAQCAKYKVIESDNDNLRWWELLLTPVMEKVDQSEGDDGLPNSIINISMWGWNQSADMPDDRALYSWEFDTDTETLFPVDLISDGTVEGTGRGAYGAVTNENNPQLTNGFNLFAPMGKCSASTGACQTTTDCPAGACLTGGTPCHFDVDCDILIIGDTCVGAQTCEQQLLSYNGQLGGNRVGKNSCFFENGTITPDAFEVVGTSNPIDDDVDNDGNGDIDEFVTAAGPLRNTDIVSFNGRDMRLFTLEDIYQETGNTFQAALGLLNFEGQPNNSAGQGFGIAVDDMFVEWFEYVLNPDLTSCDDGQCAAIEVPSIEVYQGATALPVSLLDARPYGQACQGGTNSGSRCSTNGNGCPGGGACNETTNDCNLNGIFNEFGIDSDDCDDDGTLDVVVRATSDAETSGEILVLNQVSVGSPEYRGSLVISVLGDNEGVLFVKQVGQDAPTVIITYDDNDDGSGRICQNSVIPEQQGRVQAAVDVNLELCDVSVVGTSFTDNGDSDIFADSSETVLLGIDVKNNCGFRLSNCLARLSSNSDEVECIKNGTVPLGDIAIDELKSSGGSFEFKMDDVLADRTTQNKLPFDNFLADFNVAISCDQIDGLAFPQNFSLSLDLNVNDHGESNTAWVESFEGGGGVDPFVGTKFEAQNNDAGIPGNSNAEGLINGDGWRCQYTDPDWVNSASYNQDSSLDCFPAMNMAHANAVFWQVDGSNVTAGSPDGGRAKVGTRSMYFGIFLNHPDDDFTTPLATVEAAGTPTIINLGLPNPKLSFWQQISLADHRRISAPDRRSADRGALQVLLHDEAGNESSDWTNLQPIQNAYDEQNADNFFNCEFDPVDDGNTEDDFFDPTDPDRFSGPSSTCFPEFTWAWMGSTTGNFAVNELGHATTPPASTDNQNLTGGYGSGTWIETIVDLSQFRGRRVKLRFVVTSIKATAENLFEQFGDGDERDDGWWVDDMEIDQVFTGVPASFKNDNFVLGTCADDPEETCIGFCSWTDTQACSGETCPPGEHCVGACTTGACLPVPPGCGTGCTVVTAKAFVSPVEILNPGNIMTPAPGQIVTINGAEPLGTDPIAAPSEADSCLSGNLQFQYCRDGDVLGGGPVLPDGDCNDPDDSLIRGWTDNAVLTVAPQATATYTMEVRCSTLTTCFDTESVTVDVTCPNAENALGLKSLFAVDVGACSISTTTECSVDADCPETETCDDQTLRLRWLGQPLDVDVWESQPYRNVSRKCSTDGETIYPPTCSTNAECVTGTCSITQQACHEDSECPGAETCDGRCSVTTALPCVFNSDCPGSETCDNVGEFCLLNELSTYPGDDFSTLTAANEIPLAGIAVDPGEVVAILVKADGALNTLPDGEYGFFCNSRTWRSGGTSEIPEIGFIPSDGRDESLGDPTP